MAQYRVLVGIDYPPNKRAEIGEVVSDLPGDSIKWLLEQGLIESADGKSSKKQTAITESETKVEVAETPIQYESSDETTNDKAGE